MSKDRPTTVEQYIVAAPEQAHQSLRELRAILKQAAPKATEAIKWGHPVFEDERILFAYSAHKTHLNFMPTRTTLDQFREELRTYKTGVDTIQFPYDEPLPKRLIKKVAKYRIKEVAEGSLWMHR
jgi:uncharacterized protein YdhG (YjbR/CyaY superfamily)